jgi:hypothetical protein
MMEAARTSETLLNFYQTTRRYNPEDRHIRTRRRENLKYYELRSFLELRTNCRRFFVGFADIAKPLIQLNFAELSVASGGSAAFRSLKVIVHGTRSRKRAAGRKVYRGHRCK